jgi:anticodon nuclease prrC
MGKSLAEIAQELQDKAKQAKSPKRIQLIYAFNGVGKTRLSQAFKDNINSGIDNPDEEIVIYYNAFTEDLFYWDNHVPKLCIQPNSFTNWIIRDQGGDANIATHFSRYTNKYLTAKFEGLDSVRFSYAAGNAETISDIKISKGEESCFIWSVFYHLLDLIIENRNTGDSESKEFGHYEYIFIDDPVSSLDENHLIYLAIDIAELIKRDTSELKFIITTHNPLFYNVLWNELNSSAKGTNEDKYKPRNCRRLRLDKLDDGSYQIDDQTDDSPFSHHITLLQEIDKAIGSGKLYKYHFTFLRQILEKMSTFLGYNDWKILLPPGEELYYNRILNLSSHSKVSSEEVPILSNEEEKLLSYLVEHIHTEYKFRRDVTTPPNSASKDEAN